MSDHLALERADIYGMFEEAAESLEVEIENDGLFIFEEEGSEGALDDTVEDVREMYYSGAIGSGYTTIVTIAAIAFCDMARIEAIDYAEEGGEKYE